MTTKAHLAPIPATPDEEVWAAGTETRYEQGEISADAARKLSGLPVPEHRPDETGALPGHINSIGSQATAQKAELELVDENHVPQPGVRRESTYKPPKATTARDKAARDMGEAHRKQGIVPFGHDPIRPRIVE